MRNQWKLHRNVQTRKLNNQGMTLVEVLVAMAILAVVVTPTLRMFSTSSGMNLRSKLRQRATTVGESVMESFKAYTMEGLCKQFSGGSLGWMNGSASVEAYYGASADPTTPKPALRNDGSLNEDATEYHFKINNVTYEYSKYNIDIYATPKNSQVVNFKAPNIYSDAIIEIKEQIVQEEGSSVNLADVFTELKNKAKTSVLAAHPTYNITDVTLSNVKRTIDIAITDDGTSQTVTKGFKYTCDAEVLYTYYPTGSTVPSSGSTTVDNTVCVYEVKYDDGAGGETTSYKVYDNSGTIAGMDTNNKHYKLNNVYIYYFPAFKDIYGTGCEDEINITGNLTDTLYGNGTDAKGYGTEPLNIFLVRQVPTNMSDVEIETSDANYRYNVNMGITGSGQFYLIHNLGEKLKDELSYYPTPLSGHVSGVADTNMKTIGEGIVDKTNLIYEIKVEVYDAKNGVQMAEFTGTKNEK